MAYAPTQSDFNNEIPSQNVSAAGYRPQQSDFDENPSLLSEINNSAPVNFVNGVGDALRQLPIDIGNLANRGINALTGSNLSQMINPQFGNGTAYNQGRAAGNATGFVAGGEGLDAVRAAGEGIPLIGKGAEFLGNNAWGSALKRIAGSAGYGAVTNPNDPTGGAEKGAAFGAAGEALPYALPAAGALLSPIRPEPVIGQIRNLLSQGMGIEATGKSIASDVNTAKNYQTGLASVRYNNVFNQVPDGAKITDTIPLENQQYNAIDPNITKGYGYKLATINQNYLKNPTFQNAHELQSDLGKAQYRIDSSPNSTYADQNISEGLGMARDALKSDMGNYLNTIKPGLGDEYNSASDFYKENVVPYNEDPRVSALANKLNTNPRSISAIFKNPSEGLQKVVGDMDSLGLNTSNKILSPSLARVAVTRTPENMNAAIGKLDEWGLGSYRTPEFNQLADSLKSRLNLRNGVQQIGGAAGALAAAHGAGGGNEGLTDLLAYELGGRWIPGTMRTMGRIGTPLYQGAQKTLSPLYPHIAKALIANMVPGGQQ